MQLLIGSVDNSLHLGVSMPPPVSSNRYTQGQFRFIKDADLHGNHDGTTDSTEANAEQSRIQANLRMDGKRWSGGAGQEVLDRMKSDSTPIKYAVRVNELGDGNDVAG